MVIFVASLGPANSLTKHSIVARKNLKSVADTFVSNIQQLKFLFLIMPREQMVCL